MSYKNRSVTESIHYLLNNFPAVAVLGARQVGKSTLLQNIFPNAVFFDLERDADFQRINDDPALLLQETERPIVFDEAQLSPSLFRALRVAIDQQRQQTGQFLLSGSSSPQLLKQISETLAGRVAIVELDPLSWHEIMTENSHSDFLISALENPQRLGQLKARLDKKELLNLCLYGGYPEPVLKRQDKKFFRLWMENYLKTYVERDIRALFPQLNIDAYKRFVQMLAFASGEIINASKFARSLDVSQPTIKHYLEIIEGTFLWRQIPSYQKNIRKRLVKMPKGHLRDTGLINYFLRLHNENDMKAHPQFGQIWEIFITEQIIRHFKNNLESVEYYYYRTQNKAEVDLVLETSYGLIPIEIKAGSVTSKRQIRSLEQFIKEHNCRYGLVVNNGDEVYKLSDKVYQVPAIFL
ncbi:MAG TPA: ATP-binding protein [Leucothrix mucor]|uniref:ATP-binding protein n=1 Tax=Leucothrix mucor TaxID=45248 RepID=A0A7V2WUE9_LEUMU|nr:ATP-binding protein [Leucothrix mucor]